MTFKTIALIAAAGTGSRLSSSLPKQFLTIGSLTIIERTVAAFANNPLIDAIAVVINEQYLEHYQNLLNKYNLLPFIKGGKTRQESVRMGLENIASYNPELVLIHDAARPFVSDQLITNIVEELKEHQAVLPVRKICDTVKKITDRSLVTVPREELLLAHTPQGFHYKTIRNLHNEYQSENVTDEAALCEMAHIKISTVESPQTNFKITNDEDLKLARCIIASQYENRIGFGYDTHCFSEEVNQASYATIGGIQIPYHRSIIAHSDGDVVLHALMDALLGSCGAGDIGQHFPPNDEKCKGADSSKMLLQVVGLIKEKCGEIVNIDITILAEAPKINPYRQQIVQNICKLLSLSPDHVGIKATTTEKMGFIGRGEGIAAYAVANVRYFVE